MAKKELSTFFRDAIPPLPTGSQWDAQFSRPIFRTQQLPRPRAAHVNKQESNLLCLSFRPSLRAMPMKISQGRH